MAWSVGSFWFGSLECKSFRFGSFSMGRLIGGGGRGARRMGFVRPVTPGLLQSNH